MPRGSPVLIVLSTAVALSASPEREPALLEAARGGDAARVEALVRQGANVNAATAGGLTPLIVAAAGGRTGVARVLIEAGADPDAPPPQPGAAPGAAPPHG